MADSMFDGKDGVNVKDLPFVVELRGERHFKVWAPPVLGNDADGKPVFGREVVELASEDDVKVFDAFAAVVAERDWLLSRLREVQSKPAPVASGNAKSK